MRSIKEAELKDKRILLRVGFDVPINSSGQVVDDTRIINSLPTIKYLMNSPIKKLIIITHLGRPVIRSKEKITKIIEGNINLSVLPVAKKLADWLKIKNVDSKMIWEEKYPLPYYKLGEKIEIWENIRFLEGESKNDQGLNKNLAEIADIYINDAFSVCHRAHSSTYGVAKLLPAYAGLSLQEEVENLSQILAEPEHPFIMILGGAKINDKIIVVQNLIKKADFILLGGVMANTFLAARGFEIKKSLVAKDSLETAEKLINKYGKKFVLPMDLIWNKDRIVDIGPATAIYYQKYIDRAKTVFANGPLGLISYGMDNFCKGTEQIFKYLAESKARSIISGGDSIAEVNKLKLTEKMDFISTGGGAALEFLAGKELPGIEALN